MKKAKITELQERLIRSVLNEGASDILYHFTYLKYLVNILKTDEINLTSAVGSKADLNVNAGKYFFLSTTRSKNSGYVTGNVKIVLDGRKLKDNYKVVPVDYWQYSKNPKDYDDKSTYLSALKSEQEDRVVSDKPFISNAKKYILEIHILIDENKVEREIVRLSRDNGIKLFLYSDRKSWLNQRNPVDIDTVEQVETEYTYGSGGFDYEIAAFISYKDRDSYKKIVDYLDDSSKIDHLNTKLNQLKRIDSNDIRTFSREIHNIRSKADKNSRFLLGLLANSMRKFKVKTLEDYFSAKEGIDRSYDYKKDLLSFIRVTAISSMDDALGSYFADWIEIDGVQYNSAYDSNELRKVLNDYLLVLFKVIAEVIDKNDVLKYSYLLSRSELKDKFDLKDVSVSDKLNITSMPSSYEDGGIDDYARDLFNYILRDIDESVYDKIDEIKMKIS